MSTTNVERTPTKVQQNLTELSTENKNIEGNT